MCSPNSSCQCGAPPSCECIPANPAWLWTLSLISWFSCVMPSIPPVPFSSMSVSLGVPVTMLLGRIVTVAPGHVQVAVDAAQQRQVHLFPVDLDGAEAGLSEPAQVLDQGARHVGGGMGGARE